jgi:hypothetical protein
MHSTPVLPHKVASRDEESFATSFLLLKREGMRVGDVANVPQSLPDAGTQWSWALADDVVPPVTWIDATSILSTLVGHRCTRSFHERRGYTRVGTCLKKSPPRRSCSSCSAERRRIASWGMGVGNISRFIRIHKQASNSVL